MIQNEEFYNDNLEDILQAIINKGQLQEDLKNADPLPPQKARIHARLGENVIVIERTCRVTGEEFSFDVSIEEWKRWKGGALIQQVWPDMPADHREIIQTGWTPAEWDVVFND